MRRSIVIGGRLAIIALACAVVPTESFAKPRIERRIERLETLERRIEAEAKLPPRPADVRRALRRGEPLPGAAANNARSAPAPRGSPPAAPRPAPARPTQPSIVGRPAPPARAPAPVPTIEFPPIPQATAQYGDAGVTPAPRPEPASPVSQATAIDDGTRSVLVRESPTPVTPAELLPTPPLK